MSTPDITLVIGNKNYSSWSLRGWLALRLTGAAFAEVLVPLDRPETRETLRRYSPSGLVPLLRIDGLEIWDSLAIGEYLAERFPEAGLWPADRATRALARSAVAELHSGFVALRSEMSIDLRRRRSVVPSPACQADIARVQALWRRCRALAGEGPFLFGAPSLADAFYAPVAGRFVTYGVALEPEAAAYVRAIGDWALYREWLAAAEVEPWDLGDHH